MQPKQFYVRTVMKDGRVVTEEFSMEFMARCAYNTQMHMAEEMGFQSVHMGKVGEPSPDVMQKAIERMYQGRA